MASFHTDFTYPFIHMYIKNPNSLEYKPGVAMNTIDFLSISHLAQYCDNEKILWKKEKLHLVSYKK